MTASSGSPSATRALANLAPGDPVVSTHHGVGYVVGHGVRTLLGAEREYLTVEIPKGRVRIMIPVDQIGESAALRPLSSQSELRSALEILATSPAPLAGTWQTRKKDIVARLAAGDLASLAEVVRDYAHAAATKPLATNDRELYRHVRTVVTEEVGLGLGFMPTRAAAEIDAQLPVARPLA